MHIARHTPADADSVAVVPERLAAATFHTADVNAVVSRRRPAEIAALSRLLDFLDISSLTPVAATLDIADMAPAIGAVIDRLLPDSAAQLPVFSRARDQLAVDLAQTAELIHSLTGARRIATTVFVQADDAPAQGFHQDEAPLVVVTAYRGAGTELLPNRDADWRCTDMAADGFTDAVAPIGACVQAHRGDRVLIKGRRHLHAGPVPGMPGLTTASIHRAARTGGRVVAVAFALG